MEEDDVEFDKFLSFRKIPVLEKTNHHPRDDNISFKTEGHIYTIRNWDTSKFLSVTGWCNTKFEPFNLEEIASKKLDKLSSEKLIQLLIRNEGRNTIEELISKEIGDKAQKSRTGGTRFHQIVECILNDPYLDDGYCNGDLYQSLLCTLMSCDNNCGDLAVREPELHYFTKFLRKFHYLQPYRTEWRLYHEEYKITGTIDAVYKDENGNFLIFDWKRSREFYKGRLFGNNLKDPHLHDHFRENTYSKYTMQLNLYRIMLKDKYDIDVKSLYILRLHPDDKNFELIPLPILEEPIRKSLEIRRNL